MWDTFIGENENSFGQGFFLIIKISKVVRNSFVHFVISLQHNVVLFTQ
jgi:hypothetical protein